MSRVTPLEEECLLVLRSRWRDSPLGEGDDIKDDQIHEGDEHQDAQGARETCLAEYLPVRNDDDESDDQGTEGHGKKGVVRSVDVDVSGVDLL